MKIAVFGAGGVGGYFGGLLAHAGHDVTYIARGEHLATMKTEGLKVRSVNGDFDLDPVKATAEPGDVGPVEYVIVGVKHYQLEAAAPGIRPLVGDQTTVVPLLNGVDAHETLIEALGSGPVVGGLCSIVSKIETPGVIRQESALRRVVVGELDRTRSERVEKIVAAWQETGAEAVHAEDIYVAMWTKFLFIASFGGITSLSRANKGEVMRSPETRQLFVEAMREVEALARAQGIALAPNVVDDTSAMVERFEPTATSSMQRDVAAGKPFELEAFSGTIVRMADALGVPAPVHKTLYALLLPALRRVRS